MRIARVALAALALVVGAAGCNDDDGDITPARVERADAPVTPPPGWRTVVNRTAGFTVAIPRAWTARDTRRGTVIRSDDRLVAISISADRSPAGRELPPGTYARRTMRKIPRFAGIVDRRVARLPGSRYKSAVLTATGTVAPSNLSQRISVVIFHRPELVTYGALVFRNAGVKPGFNDRTIDRVLRSFRAEPPSA